MLLALLLAAVPLRAVPSLAPQKGEPKPNEVSRELQRLYDEDHQDQDVWTGTDEEFDRRQRARRDRVLEILALGKLGPVEDWANAAWLMLHGDGPEDHALAHALSVRPAIARLTFGGFAAAATLDRLLESLGRAQAFGTQSYEERPGAPLHSAVPNSIRKVFALDPVPGEAPRAKGSAKELAKLLKQAEQGTGAAPTSPPASPPQWLVRARELVGAGVLEKDKDYVAAARLLLHSPDADDLLMAHVCAVAAGIEGHADGLRLSAETFDAFLLACGRAQLFGTAKGTDGKPRQPCALAPEVLLRGYGLPVPRPATKNKGDK